MKSILGVLRPLEMLVLVELSVCILLCRQKTIISSILGKLSLLSLALKVSR